MADETGIDDSLYSRQRYVLGDSAMHRMAKSNVFLAGLGGLGVETAKNIALAGVKSLTLHDPRPASLHDLASQFFIGPADVAAGTSRAEISAPRVAELNPYVSIHVSGDNMQGDLAFLKQYQCVILTDSPLAEQIRVDAFCRAQDPPIAFVAGAVRGVAACLFVDAGDAFEVVDSTGEELKEVYISDVTQAENGVVTTHDHRLHELEDGDRVVFKEVQGMVELNTGVYPVKVISPHSFSIGDTRAFSPYVRGGMARQLHRRLVVKHQPLSQQLQSPAVLLVDFAKMEAPANTLLAFRAADAFYAEHGRLPRPWHAEDAAAFVALAASINAASESKIEASEKLLKTFAYTCSGELAALTASLGGWAAQEAIKLLTSKFTPLSQFLLFEASEVVPPLDGPPVQLHGDRMDPQRICLGNELSDKLAGLNVFMVGCGAIGCEMIKNLALMGVATAEGAVATITDNDLIEKSNLNRQFLFRPHHIQRPKSTTAAEAAQAINPGMHINALQHRVGQETEVTVFNDPFFKAQHVVINALDNIAARLYVDSRCVTNQRPLLESGTLGTKGHVQVIVPFKTESYGSMRDPPDPEIPFCTLKSFPNNIEHTIQWAREKFGMLFELKPAEFNKFWQEIGGPEAAIAGLEARQGGKAYARVHQVVKMMRARPTQWADCVRLARLKFEKYFSHKALQLLACFPPETTLKDGSPFWQSPKRQPTPLVFSAADPLHLAFVHSAAALFAHTYAIDVPQQDDLQAILPGVAVPPFVSKAKKVVTDESVKRTDAAAATQLTDDDEAFPAYAAFLRSAFASAQAAGLPAVPQLQPSTFEKDDDTNHHIDFISATANLRARMYGIDTVDRLHAKRVAGKIVPAIATSTSAVSGLVAVELIKVVKASPLADFKNTFLNMAVPLMIFSEPAAAIPTQLPGNQSFTLWDRWELVGGEGTTLAQFLAAFQEKYHLTPTGLFLGAAMIYVPAFAGHDKKLPRPMRKLLKYPKEATYVDLTVTFASEPEDVAGPLVRYYL